LVVYYHHDFIEFDVIQVVKRKKEIREKFRNEVYKRDNYTCVYCGFGPVKVKPQEYLDAHHITDRSDMPNGGYVKENGVTLCKEDIATTYGTEPSCHMKAEKFHITNGEEWVEGLHPEDLYEKIGTSYDKAYKKSLKL